MWKPEISLKRVSCNEKASPKKKMFCHKVNFHGRLIENLRLKSVINHITSVKDTTPCTSSRVLTQTENSKLNKCNRTVSLEQFKLQELTLGRKRNSSCQEDARSKMSEGDKILETRKKLLAFMTLSRFLKNVWRKSKFMSETQDVNLKSCNNEINNLKMQVASLKSLLTSDEKIMANSIKEINSLKGLLSILQDNYTELKAEKEQVEKRSENLIEELSKTLTELRNKKNVYILAKSEAMAFETQLEKEREKIRHLRKENKSLLTKLEKGLPSSSSTNETPQKSKMQQEIRSSLYLFDGLYWT